MPPEATTEGLDLQVRTCEVIHLDLPWEPATFPQRNGRAVRRGNLQALVTPQRMARVSVHPELDTPPVAEGSPGVSLDDLPTLDSEAFTEIHQGAK